jgi:hypothetical protein
MAQQVVEPDDVVGEVMHRHAEQPVGAKGREPDFDAVLVAGVLGEGRRVP